jgi:hypothetical protein
MRRNVAGQFIGAQMITAADGSAFTGAVTVAVTGDAGTQATGSVGSGACAHEGGGFHTYAPAQAETNYTHVAFTFSGTGAIPVTVQIYPLAYNSSGQMDVGSVATGGITAGSIAADAIGASELAADAVTEIATGVWAAATRELTAGTNIVLAKGTGVTGFNDLSAAQVNAEVDTAIADAALATAANLATVAGYLDTEIAAILADTNELQTDWANGGRLDLILDARSSQASVDTIDGIVDAILVDTAEIGAAGAGLTAVPWNAAWDAEVQSEVTDALNAYDPPTNAEMVARTLAAADYATSTALATVDTVVDAIKVTTDKLDDTLEDDAGTFRFTTNALEEAPTGGSAPTAADIADAVWEEAIADHSGTSGSVAEALAAAGSAGDPWATALPGAYGAGTAGKIIGDNLNATVSSRATQTSVDDLPTNAELTTALGTVDDAVLAILGTPAGASLSADVAAVKAQTAAIETDTQDIQGRLPAALVSGRIDASVGAMAANVMTAAAAAADLTTELQSGLATASALSTVAGYLDTEVAAILAAVDTEVAAIKAKTDNLPAAPAATGDIPTATQNADALLNRDMSAVSDTNARSPLNALRVLRNKIDTTGGTLTVSKEDDTTEAWTAALTSNASADPITGVDPA